MKFYKENKINPLGGCLPLLAQMPVFIIMYRLLRGLTVREGGLGSGIGHIAGQVQHGSELTPWVLTDQFFRPEHLLHSTDLYKSLSTTNTMNFFGMDLALSAAEAMKIGLIVAIPYLVLLIIILITWRPTGLLAERVAEVKPDDQIDEYARKLTRRLANGPTLAHAMTKRILRGWRDDGMAGADRVTRRDAAALFETEDLKNAVDSFLENGPGKATYEGR